MINNFTVKQNRLYRVYEMLPGMVIWSFFIIIFLLTFFEPLWAIYFNLVFSSYWLIKAIYLSVLLLYSWSRYNKMVKVDWFKKLQVEKKNWSEYHHLIFLPTYKEDYEIIKNCFSSLASSQYPKDKIILVLAGEEKDKENFLKNAERAQKEFFGIFKYILVTLHPRDVEGELAGKGSNLHYAGPLAQQLVNDFGLPYEKIIVSSFDIDTCVHPQYFACLTYNFLSVKDPYRHSYQPIAIFNNNIWEAPALTRLVSRATTFWLFTETAKPKLYFTFSSHALSFTTLVKIGFWEKDVVSEDSRIFLQCYNYYDGDYSTVPLHIPVFMDAVASETFFKTLANQYKQILRWGYGVENVPYMLWHFFKNKRMPWFKKVQPLSIQFFGSCNWATVPIIILLLGNLPPLFARLRGLSEPMIYNSPFILSWIMSLAMIGVLIMAIISFLLLPPRPLKHKFFHNVLMLIQWILFPITLVIFGSIPAADGITHLMTKKYLGFQVTEKSRKLPKKIECQTF